MSASVTPRTLVPDSATLSWMAEDFESGDPKAKLRSVLDELEQLNVLFVLTLHQLIEVLRYENDRIAERRIRFLIHLADQPNVCWIRSRTTGGIGTVIDVVAAEVEARIRAPAHSLADLADEVRSNIFRFGSPPTEDFVDLYQARPLLLERMSREREVASLSFADLFDPGCETIGDLRRRPTRSRNQAVTLLRRIAPQLEFELRKGGDKRLSNPGQTAQEFIDSVVDDLPNPEDGEHPIDAILRYVGLEPSQVSDETPWRKVASLAVFRTQLKVVKPLLNLDPSRVDAIPPEQLPSFRIQEGLRKHVRQAHRRRGSDLNDAHLAVLLCYFDYVVVDRRTHEYLKQIWRKDQDLARTRGQWLKLSKYDELPAKLRRDESPN